MWPYIRRNGLLGARKKQQNKVSWPTLVWRACAQRTPCLTMLKSWRDLLNNVGERKKKTKKKKRRWNRRRHHLAKNDNSHTLRRLASPAGNENGRPVSTASEMLKEAFLVNKLSVCIFTKLLRCVVVCELSVCASCFHLERHTSGFGNPL